MLELFLSSKEPAIHRNELINTLYITEVNKYEICET
jgi:hypothetical protein